MISGIIQSFYSNYVIPITWMMKFELNPGLRFRVNFFLIMPQMNTIAYGP